MTELSPMEDKFVVHVQKSCNPGPYLDPSKVTKLPDFFQEKSTAQTITNAIEAVVLAGLNVKETVDKVPAYLGPALKGVDIQVTEHDKDGHRKKHHYRLPIVDRKSKGEIILNKLVENLMCCSKFLSCNISTCKECPAKQGELAPLKMTGKLTLLKTEPTTELSKKEPTTCSPKTPKCKHQFTVYCRRNCKVGPLLDPDKIQKIPTSFSGSLPKIIQSLVPAIVLSGYNPNDAIKKVPSSQGRCILVNVKIGKLNQMCLVRSLDSSVRFWAFLRKFHSAFGMCENFFAEKAPRKSACKKCRNLVAKADYYSSDDDGDFQDLKGYKDQSEKRKRKRIQDEPTSVKTSKLTEDSSQVKCKEFKVVIKKLPQETVNNYLQRGSLPRTPTRKQVKQVYLHGKKVKVVDPQVEESPRKSLFAEAPSLSLSPVEGRDDEADNLFNIGATQENTQAEHAEMTAEEIPIEEADDNDNYLLDTFLDQGVEDDNEEVMGLKEMSERMEEEEERNPLQGLFEKSEEQQDNNSSREENLEEDKSSGQYSSPFDAVELFSPGSFFGDVLGSTEANSSSERNEMGGTKSEQEANKKSPSKDKELQDTTSVDMEETSVTQSTQSDSANKVEAENFKEVEVKEEKNSGESETSIDNSAMYTTCKTPAIQPLGAEDFSLTVLTSTTCQAPPTPRLLNSISGSGIPSTQVPQQSLPGNVPDSGYQDVTFGMPIVSLPGNSGANSTLPLKHDIDSILLPGKQPVSFPGNFCSNTSHPVSQGTINTSSISISSGALPGPNTNTSSLSTCTSNQHQFPQVDCRPNSSRPNTAVQKEVHDARQKANEILTQLRKQAQSFTTYRMNVGLGSPYSYQGVTNNFMANQVPQAGSHSLYSVQSPRYFPSNQASQSLDKHLQVPAARHNLPLTPSLTPRFGHTFMNTSLPIRQPYSSTNQPSSLPTSQSIPCTNVLSGGGPATRYYASTTMGQIVSQSIPKTNPSTVVMTMTRNYPPTCFQRNSYSVPNISPSVASMAQYYPPSTPFQVPSYSIQNTNPSTAAVQSNAWQYPGLASGNLVNQSLVNNFSPVGAFPSSYYPTAATRHPVSQSFSVGTNSSPAVVPTSSCYPTSITRHPVSQSFVGTNSSPAVVPNARCYPPSITRHPVSQSFVGTNSSPAVAPSASCYPPSMIRHPVSQSFVGTNLSPAVAPNASCYPPSATRHPVSQSLVGTNFSSAGTLTSGGYPTSAPAHPVSQSLVGTNPSSSEVQAMIGQASQTLPLTSKSNDTGKIQASLNVPTTFAALSSIQTSITTSISESSCIPTGSATSTNVDELEITTESSNNKNNSSSDKSEAVTESSDHETQKLLKKNPLAQTTFALLKRCEILPQEKGLHFRKKLEQMLWNRRQRLAITQKDINDLEEIVGAEIQKDVAFRNLVKLITAEPVFKDSNGVYRSIAIPENQAKQRNAPVTGQGAAMIQSVNGEGRNTSVMQSLGSGHMDVTPAVELDSDDRTENSTSDDEVIIIEQSSQKSSVPTSGSRMVNNQPVNDISRNHKFNPSLPKPSLRVSKVQGITILLWDLPDQSLIELVKEYELYAIQLEANKQLTEDLVRTTTWKKIGNVKALPPPMAITLTNLLEGFTNYMIVRGVDKDGRVGPFSSLCKVIGS